MKYCWLCSHIVYCDGQPYYSEFTPDTPTELYCAKNKWNLEDITSSRDLGKALSMAKTCELFIEEKETTRE